MHRPTLIHLLIIIVTICPYVCLDEVDGNESELNVTRCCCEDPLSSDGELPISPVDQEADCLCQGAIMDGQLRTVELDPPQPSTLGWYIDDGDALSGSHLIAQVSFAPPHHFPLDSTGRVVCLLTCALLL